MARSFPWFRWFLKRSAARRPARKAPRPFLPRLEALELRDMPSATPPTVWLQGLGSGAVVNTYANVGFQNNTVGYLMVTDNTSTPITNLTGVGVNLTWGDGGKSQAKLVYVGTQPALTNNTAVAEYAIEGTHKYVVSGPQGYRGAIPANGSGLNAGYQAIKTCNVEATVTGNAVISAVGSGDMTVTKAEVYAMPGNYAGTAGPTAPAGPAAGPQPQTFEQVDRVQSGSAIPLTSKSQTQKVLNYMSVPYLGGPGAANETNPGDYQVYINWGNNGTWTSKGELVEVFNNNPNQVAEEFAIVGTVPSQQALNVKPGAELPVTVYITGPGGISISQYVANIQAPAART
jgi:hypothetical protein